MKWALYLLLGGFLILANYGCVSVEKVLNPNRSGITIKDAKKIHPFGKPSYRVKVLTQTQSQRINNLYGEEITQEGDRITYYQSKGRKSFYRSQFGNIFLVHGKGELKALNILVCTTRGQIDEILVKNNPIVKGRTVIPDEFLQQYIGRSLKNSWEVAQDPPQLLTLPSRVRPMVGYPKLSEEVTKAIRKVLVWAIVLNVH